MELLSPAGNMRSAMAALSAGADAVYIGGNFSAALMLKILMMRNYDKL